LLHGLIHREVRIAKLPHGDAELEHISKHFYLSLKKLGRVARGLQYALQTRKYCSDLDPCQNENHRHDGQAKEREERIGERESHWNTMMPVICLWVVLADVQTVVGSEKLSARTE